MLSGVWTIFPHVIIASFGEGDVRSLLISQLFPGDAPGESYTIQNYLLEKETGGQSFHQWLRRILDTDDEGLNELFSTADAG